VSDIIRMNGGTFMSGAIAGHAICTMRPKRSGATAAERRAMNPPSDEATTSLRLIPIPSSTSATNPSAISRNRRGSGTSGSASLNPVPGRSTRMPVYPGKEFTMGAHVDPELGPPWMNSTGSPSPMIWSRTSVPVVSSRTNFSSGWTLTDCHSFRSASRYAGSFTVCSPSFAILTCPVHPVDLGDAPPLGPTIGAKTDRLGVVAAAGLLVPSGGVIPA